MHDQMAESDDAAVLLIVLWRRHYPAYTDPGTRVIDYLHEHNIGHACSPTACQFVLWTKRVEYAEQGVAGGLLLLAAGFLPGPAATAVAVAVAVAAAAAAAAIVTFDTYDSVDIDVSINASVNIKSK